MFEAIKNFFKRSDEMNLGDVLKDLDIDIPVEGDKIEGEGKPVELDLEKIPEEHRAAVKTAIEAGKTRVGELENQVAQKDLTINTLQSSFEKAASGKPVEEKKDAGEKLFGVSDKDDYYNPAFVKIAEDLKTIRSAISGKDTDTFMGNLESFATKNPDIAKYAVDMDRIAAEHPTLLKDIPKLYTLGKGVHDRRAEKEEKVRKSTEREINAAALGSETGGTASGKVQPGQVKTITEAFENAQTSMSKV
jgi:hypothetical protein